MLTSERTTPTRNGKSIEQIVREYFPDASDDYVDFLLWNETGWPCFWNSDDPEDSMRLQLARAACRENFAEFSYFDGHRLMDIAMDYIKETRKESLENAEDRAG